MPYITIRCILAPYYPAKVIPVVPVPTTSSCHSQVTQGIIDIKNTSIKIIIQPLSPNKIRVCYCIGSHNKRFKKIIFKIFIFLILLIITFTSGVVHS